MQVTTATTTMQVGQNPPYTFNDGVSILWFISYLLKFCCNVCLRHLYLHIRFWEWAAINAAIIAYDEQQNCPHTGDVSKVFVSTAHVSLDAVGMLQKFF